MRLSHVTAYITNFFSFVQLIYRHYTMDAVPTDEYPLVPTQMCLNYMASRVRAAVVKRSLKNVAPDQMIIMKVGTSG
jgi:hypothetical protein